MNVPSGCAGAVLRLDAVARDMSGLASNHALLMHCLTEGEWLHCRQLPVRKRQIEWLAGRLAAKHALQTLIGLPHWPRESTVRYDAAGRPSFGIAALSISHSRGEAVAVSAHAPVGVDTETFDAVQADSISMLVGADEVSSVRRGWGCDTQAARTLLWCLKEALFKAAGDGAFAPFASALRIMDWQPTRSQPVWTWCRSTAPAHCHSWPNLIPWAAMAELTADAARVVVHPLTVTTPRASVPS